MSALSNLSKMVTTRTFLYAILAILLLFIGFQVYRFYSAAPVVRVKESMSSGPSKQAEMMLFFADWCPHCKKAKPEWEAVKAEYDGKKINGYTVTFVEYDCSDETPEVERIVSKYNIEGYPTVKLLKDDQIVEFDAKPTKATLEQFLNTVL